MATDRKTEVCFVVSDEKALFLLKASRMFDGGYRDFIDLQNVIDRITKEMDAAEQCCKESTEKGEVKSQYLHAGREAGYVGAMKIVKEEVG